MASPRRTVRGRPWALVAVVLGALLLAGAPAAGATGYPPLPVPLDRQFLGNLTLPSVAPGGSSALTFSLADPSGMKANLTSVVLTFELYAFNGYPGDGSAALPVSNAPLLENTTTSAQAVNLSVPPLTTGGPAYHGSVGLVTSSATPSGTYAVRIALSFVANATTYRLESRGWFSNALWAQATLLPNGSPTLNLSLLQVSGVLPETGALVVASDWPWALGAIMAASLVLVAVAVWVHYRRRPGSSSGAG